MCLICNRHRKTLLLPNAKSVRVSVHTFCESAQCRYNGYTKDLRRQAIATSLTFAKDSNQESVALRRHIVQLDSQVTSSNVVRWLYA